MRANARGVEGTRPLAPQGQPLRLSLRIRANPRIIANLSAGRIHAPPTQKQTAARLAGDARERVHTCVPFRV